MCDSRRNSEARKQLKAEQQLQASQELVSQSLLAASADALGAGADAGAEAAEGAYEEPTFEVERIIGKRFDALGRVQYRIKWVGFDNRYASPLCCAVLG